MTCRNVTSDQQNFLKLGVGEILQGAVIWGWYCIFCICIICVSHGWNMMEPVLKAVLIGTCFMELRERLDQATWKGTKEQGNVLGMR